MVCKVVDHGHAGYLAANLLPSLHALHVRKGSDGIAKIDTELRALLARRRSVLQVKDFFAQRI